MESKPVIKLKEITNFVREYQAALPEWQIVEKDTLARVNGIIGQAIWFDRLRTGEYRPTFRVHVLVAPSELGGTSVLPQFLDARYRSITPKSHSFMMNSVIMKMKSSIIPNISKPFDAMEIKNLLLYKDHIEIIYSYALAFLCAYFGEIEESRNFIMKYHKMMRNFGMYDNDCNINRENMLNKLENWIEKSDLQNNLSNIVAEEKNKFLKL